MHSPKAILASLVLLFGFYATTARTQEVEKKTPLPILHFESKKVSEGLTKGGSFHANGAGDNYRFLTNRSDREQSAQAEIHMLDDDIYYVIDGSITLIVGGKLVNPKTTQPNEIRGTAIEGGETVQVSKGDVLNIPKGVPHWRKDVQQSPFLWFVVKVRSGKIDSHARARTLLQASHSSSELPASR